MEEEPKQKKKVGRPALPPEERLRNAGIRLSEEDLAALDSYCSRKGWTHTQAIRKFIELVKID